MIYLSCIFLNINFTLTTIRSELSSRIPYFLLKNINSPKNDAYKQGISNLLFSSFLYLILWEKGKILHHTITNTLRKIL